MVLRGGFLLSAGSWVAISTSELASGVSVDSGLGTGVGVGEGSRVGIGWGSCHCTTTASRWPHQPVLAWLDRDPCSGRDP